MLRRVLKFVLLLPVYALLILGVPLLIAVFALIAVPRRAKDYVFIKRALRKSGIWPTKRILLYRKDGKWSRYVHTNESLLSGYASIDSSSPSFVLIAKAVKLTKAQYELIANGDQCAVVKIFPKAFLDNAVELRLFQSSERNMLAYAQADKREPTNSIQLL